MLSGARISGVFSQKPAQRAGSPIAVYGGGRVVAMDEKLDEASRRKVFATALLTDDFEPASALVRADIAARSDRGRILKDNDDHYLVVRLGRSEETIQTSLTRRDVPYRFDEYAVRRRRGRRHRRRRRRRGGGATGSEHAGAARAALRPMEHAHRP
jgi:hypothetical protein